MVEAISEPQKGNGILVYKCRLCGEKVEHELSSNVKDDLNMYVQRKAFDKTETPVLFAASEIVHQCPSHARNHGICDLVGGLEYGQD